MKKYLIYLLIIVAGFCGYLFSNPTDWSDFFVSLTSDKKMTFQKNTISLPDKWFIYSEGEGDRKSYSIRKLTYKSEQKNFISVTFLDGYDVASGKQVELKKIMKFYGKEYHVYEIVALNTENPHRFILPVENLNVFLSGGNLDYLELLLKDGFNKDDPNKS